MKECPNCHAIVDDWCWTCPKCHKPFAPKEIVGHARVGTFDDEKEENRTQEDQSMVRDKGRMVEDDDDSVEPDQPYSPSLHHSWEE